MLRSAPSCAQAPGSMCQGPPCSLHPTPSSTHPPPHPPPPGHSQVYDVCGNDYRLYASPLIKFSKACYQLVAGSQWFLSGKSPPTLSNATGRARTPAPPGIAAAPCALCCAVLRACHGGGAGAGTPHRAPPPPQDELAPPLAPPRSAHRVPLLRPAAPRGRQDRRLPGVRPLARAQPLCQRLPACPGEGPAPALRGDPGVPLLSPPAQAWRQRCLQRRCLRARWPSPSGALGCADLAGLISEPQRITPSLSHGPARPLCALCRPPLPAKFAKTL